MSISPRKSRLPEAIAAFVTGAACLVAPVAARGDDAQELSRLREEMEQISAANRRCHNVVQCRVMSMGYDACGRPTHHVPYNDITGAGTALASKASEYTFIEEESQRGRPRPARCDLLPSPKPTCHRNQCTAGGLND